MVHCVIRHFAIVPPQNHSFMKYFFLSLCLSLTFAFNVESKVKTVTLEDVVSSRFTAKSVRGFRSMNDGQFYTLQEGNQINKYSYKTGSKAETIFDLSEIKNPGFSHFSDYVFSDDESILMVYTNTQKIHRHSHKSDYFVYNIKKKTLEALSENGPQQEASISPNAQRIAFVRQNNLFVKDLRFGTEKQITTDGEFNKIINGIPDWVYEEEFEFTRGFEWSPDGRFIAFLKFNEQAVKEYSFPLYMGASPTIAANELYPVSYKFKYPKAGETNATVSVHTYDTNNRVIKMMNLPEDDDYYIPRIRWTQSSDKLCIVRLNRHQNKMTFYLANPMTAICKLFLTEESDTYISESVFDQFQFIEDNWFVTMSEKDGYNHIYLYGLDGRLIKQVTKGEFDVTDFYGYDAKNKLFYYQAAGRSPLQREVYAIDLKEKQKQIITPMEGTNKAVFSSSFSYYLHDFTASEVPRIVTVKNNKGETLRVLEDNSKLIKELEDYKSSKREFFSFTPSHGIELNGWMVKPINFDPKKKYPVLMVQYSGPGSQKVLDEWNFGWEQVLSNDGYIVACVDGRGTGARGETFKKCTYMELGHLESDDQIEAAQYLGSLDYIDETRIGIWGWSYGGYMAALCLSRSNIFKIGIAVAPVTHWKYYDSIYTERFMRTPKENIGGYDKYSPLELADQLSGRLLLIHGSADDNVHYQNTMEYAERLVQAGKQFEMQIYTNRKHGISGGNTRMHLYQRKIDFIKTYL